RLFDNGEEEKISQFSIEAPNGAQAGSSQADSGQPIATKSTVRAVKPRAIAFYFDDLNMGLDEINSARDAADSYLASRLQAPDRAAVFTSSGKVHTDFTSDLKTLHEAMMQVNPIPNLKECPEISDYQAERMIDYEDPDAWRLAISDAKLRCHID